jgi:hypothetical protein
MTLSRSSMRMKDRFASGEDIRAQQDNFRPIGE